MRRPSHLLIAMSGAALALGSWTSASAGEVAAEPSGLVTATYIDDSGVVHYAFDPTRMPGAKVVNQAGVPLRATSDGTKGCRFEDSGQGEASGGRVLVMSEVSFDPRTCTRDLAIARYPADGVPATVATDFYTDPPGGSSAEETVSTGDSVAIATTSYIGVLQTMVEDAVEKDVTRTRSRVEWTASSSCVTSSLHDAYWYWLSSTGWERTNAWWSHGRTCDRAYTNTYGKYHNGSFCFGGDTWTEHKKTYFEGRPRGGWYWSYSMDKWGNCASWLHYDYQVTTP